MKIIQNIFLTLFITSCTSQKYLKTVESVDLEKFMGQWFVISSRPTFLEKDATNAIEIYTWNERKKLIEIDFQFNHKSFDGKLKKIPQTATLFNEKTKAHWKISPFWPLKFDYLILAVDPKYQWCVVGVPSQDYLWIMARSSQMSDEQLHNIIKLIEDQNYDVKNLVKVPQQVR